MLYSKAQTKGLQERLGDAYEVILGMRYGEPSIDAAMRQFAEQGIERILVFPIPPVLLFDHGFDLRRRQSRSHGAALSLVF